MLFLLLAESIPGILCTQMHIIRGKPERAPNTQETGSGVYICIYLCVILHSNDTMCMLKHHMLDSSVTGKGHHQRSRSIDRGSAAWLELQGR